MLELFYFQNIIYKVMFCLASYFSYFSPSLSRHAFLLFVLLLRCSSNLLLSSKLYYTCSCAIYILPHLSIVFF